MNRIAFLESSAKWKYKAACPKLLCFSKQWQQRLRPSRTPFNVGSTGLAWRHSSMKPALLTREQGLKAEWSCIRIQSWAPLLKFDLGQVIHLSLSPVIHKAEITMYVKHLSYYPPCSYSVNAVDIEHLMSQLTELKLEQKKSLHLDISPSFVIPSDILHKNNVEL